MNQKKASPSPSDIEDEIILNSLLGQEKKPYKVFEAEITTREIAFYISDVIGDPLEYAEMIYTIRHASENDRIRLYLNTPGGNIATGVQIINAIRESAATVITVLDGEAYSMGAFLFLAGDIQQVGDHGQLMFHDYSSGLVGKGNEQRAAVLSAATWFGKMMANICSPFLTDKEIEDVLNGRDLWMDSDEVVLRFQAIQAQHEKEAKQAQEATSKPATERAPKAKPAAKQAAKPVKKPAVKKAPVTTVKRK